MLCPPASKVKPVAGFSRAEPSTVGLFQEAKKRPTSSARNVANALVPIDSTELAALITEYEMGFTPRRVVKIARWTATSSKSERSPHAHKAAPAPNRHYGALSGRERAHGNGGEAPAVDSLRPAGYPLDYLPGDWLRPPQRLASDALPAGGETAFGHQRRPRQFEPTQRQLAVREPCARRTEHREQRNTKRDERDWSTAPWIC